MAEDKEWLNRYVGVVRALVDVRTRYAAWPDLWAMGARWSLDELESLERRSWLRLPREYRDWLMLVGDGGASFLTEADPRAAAARGTMRSLRTMKRETLWSAAEFMIVRRDGWLPSRHAHRLQLERHRSLVYSIDPSRRHQGFLPLGHSAAGPVVLMETTGLKPGRIWIDSSEFNGAFLPTSKTFFEFQEAWILALQSDRNWSLRSYLTMTYA